MAKREKPPAPMVVLTARGLSPVSAGDAEDLDRFPTGTEFEMIARTRRSPPQLRKYWSTLGSVIKATDLSPDRIHLHDDLKLALGYTRKSINRDTGAVYLVPDSVAMNAMNADEFRAYFDAAMMKLSEWAGFDVLRWDDSS